uniref:Uncharacterized protein n=1 Tax=Aegilops tauschii subsp. strangulata TaxID=200361 RepID=A0A453E1F8_AEGTS
QHKTHKPQSEFFFFLIRYTDGKIFADVCHPHVPSASVHQRSSP